MEFAIADLFFSLVGRLLLFIRYWNMDKVKKVLADKYENSFMVAGKHFSMLIVIWAFMLGIGALLIATIYGYLKHNLQLF